MTRWDFRFTMLLATILIGWQGGTSVFGEQLTPEQQEFFETKIRPIFADNCYECHSVNAEDTEGGLLLDSKWGWQTGGDSGPAIVPGNPDESLLVEAIRYQEDVVSAMPPKSKLSDQQIGLLEQWVKMGAARSPSQGGSIDRLPDRSVRFEQTVEGSLELEAGSGSGSARRARQDMAAIRFGPVHPGTDRSSRIAARP